MRRRRQSDRKKGAGIYPLFVQFTEAVAQKEAPQSVAFDRLLQAACVRSRAPRGAGPADCRPGSAPPRPTCSGRSLGLFPAGVVRSKRRRSAGWVLRSVERARGQSSKAAATAWSLSPKPQWHSRNPYQAPQLGHRLQQRQQIQRCEQEPALPVVESIDCQVCCAP